MQYKLIIYCVILTINFFLSFFAFGIKNHFSLYYVICRVIINWLYRTNFIAVIIFPLHRLCNIFGVIDFNVLILYEFCFVGEGKYYRTFIPLDCIVTILTKPQLNFSFIRFIKFWLIMLLSIILFQSFMYIIENKTYIVSAYLFF